MTLDIQHRDHLLLKSRTCQYLLGVLLYVTCLPSCLSEGDGVIGSLQQSEGGMEIDRMTYPEQPYGEQVNSVIAPLSFTNYNGEPVGLEDFYADPDTRLLLITTSAEWCTACIKEQPKLEKIYEDYKELGLEILVVLFEDGNFEPADPKVAERWRDRHDLTFSVVADQESPSTFSPYYDVNLTPMVMLVEVDHMKIKYLTQGFDEDQVLSLLTTYLSISP